MTITVKSNDPVADAAVNNVVAEVSESTGTLAAPEAKASEQKESEESATSETETKEEEKEESELESSEEESEKEDESEKDKPKKKGGFQRRIDKLNAKASAAQQEAEYWKNLALKSQGAGEPKKEQDAPKASTEGKPDPGKYDSHEEYVEALADWKYDQRKAKEAAEAKTSSYKEKVESFKKTAADYDDVLSDVEDIKAQPAILQSLFESDNGPALAYELAKNRAEFERINKLSPLAAVKEIGKLEDRISKASETKKIETKKTTNAPKPLEPVGTAGKGSISKSLSDPNLSQSEYERLRSEQLKKRRQA